MKRVAIYTRVSTGHQSVERQLRELRAVAEQRGWTIVAEHNDEAISGSKRADERPGLRAALRAAVRGEIDLIAVHSVDRLGRSLIDLLTTLQELHAAGADLYLHAQSIDTSTPAGRMLFQMLGIVAEFERSLIQARIRSGIATARANGVKLGRPAVADDAMRERVRALRAEDRSLRGIAAEVGCSLGTVQRILAELSTDLSTG